MADETQKEPTEEILYVWDQNCTRSSGVREHDIMVDDELFTYDFRFGQPVPMPRSHAMKFAVHDAWLVRDQHGNEVLVTPPGDPALAPVLEPDQCVAYFEELTLDSLKARAAPLHGGEKLSRANKQEIIDFLVGYNTSGPGATARPEPPVETEDMSPDELAAMFDSQAA